MQYRVKITKLPGKAIGGKINGNQIENTQPHSWGGADINSGPKDVNVTSSISAVPRNQANLEAEGGETVYGDINGDGMAEHLVIKGPRHSSGGVPLNLPDDTFIFSDTNSMKIKDPNMLAQFGKSVKDSKSYTPATLAKQYDLSKYRKLLQDPDASALERKTAEIMIRNYTMKLGALAVAQESKKGFPQGIPEVAKPYMEANGIKDEDLIPELAQPQEQMMMQNPQEGMMEVPEQMPNGEQIAIPQEMQQPMARFGYEMNSDSIPFNPGFAYPQYDDYEEVPQEYNRGGELSKMQKGGAPYGMDIAYTSEGVIRLNKYRAKYGLPPITGTKEKPLSKSDIKNAAGEMQQKILEENPELVAHYIQNVSHQPSNEVKAALKKKGITVKTNKDIVDALAAKRITAADISKGYKDDQWWYRALDTKTVKLPKAEYEAQMKKEGAIEQSGNKYFNDPTDPEMYIKYEMDEEAPAKGIEIAPPGKKADDVNRPDMYDPDFEEAPELRQAEWMTPDRLNYYGALKDRSRIQKFMPWAPRFEPEVPDPTYLDPTRELAQQSEYANLMAQQLGQFAGPQTLASNMSSIQGTGAEQAANTLSRYNNANVSTANQFAQNAANIRNQAQGINQGAAQRLYDQNTIANQQFLNSKIGADQNVRQAFGTGWKNASNLALTNAMYPQYDIDARTGNIWFQGGKDPQGEMPGATFDSLLQGYIEQGFSPAEATAAAKAAMTSRGSQSSINMDQIMQNAQSKNGGAHNPGYVTGINAFPFMFY
jgi:hypothetical protein